MTNIYFNITGDCAVKTGIKLIEPISNGGYEWALFLFFLALQYNGIIVVYYEENEGKK